MKAIAFAFMALLMLSSLSFAVRCLEDNECDSGDVCILGDCYTPMECKTNAGCGGTDVCYRGICISPTCIVTTECPTDFRCEEGRCIPKECISDSYCGKDQICFNYECVDKPPEVILEPQEEEEEPSSASFSGGNTCPVCPVCAMNKVCQPCERAPACPKLECPECGPLDGELGIPILLFGLIVVAAVGFFAGRMGGNQVEDEAGTGDSSSADEAEDINDENSFRYI